MYKKHTEHQVRLDQKRTPAYLGGAANKMCWVSDEMELVEVANQCLVLHH